ncbi:uncharacterized protein UTRI_04933 [Ustilago trichophora]|uniref:Uncharacterized protein n=1 Tax=Ustilago trichophora TaxID=86804 RepID=A0A5C3EC71_9BASI|nr:uncharacterized protein UTRI_04933 [Ustilago trichophora]
MQFIPLTATTTTTTIIIITAIGIGISSMSPQPQQQQQQQQHLSASSSLSRPISSSPPPTTPLRPASIGLAPTSPQREEELSRILDRFLSNKHPDFGYWLAGFEFVFGLPALRTKVDYNNHQDHDGDGDEENDDDDDDGDDDDHDDHDNADNESGSQYGRDLVKQIPARIVTLETVMKSRFFNNLLATLRKKRETLPQSLIQRILTIDPITNKASCKQHREYAELIDQLDQLSGQTLQSSRVKRLETLLEHAFVNRPARKPDPSLVAANSSATDFTSAFNGPSLDLLHDHLVVHNSFFPQASAPLSVHANTRARTNTRTCADTSTSTAHSTDTNTDTLANASAQADREYYAKVLPIIQSSGFGKTRMCVQLSTVHAGMLVCLRTSLPRDRDQHLVSFPPQDAEVYDYFRSVRKTLMALGLEDQNIKFPQDAKQHAIFNDAYLGILAWLEVYCDTIYTYLAQLKAASGCFDQHGNANHANAHQCWRSVVYHFADATSFKQHTLFQRPADLCSHSRLAPPPEASSPTPSSSPPSNIATPMEDGVVASVPAAAPPPALHGTLNLRHKILEHICTLATRRYRDMLTEYKSQMADPNMLVAPVRSHLKKRLSDMEGLPPRQAVSQSFFFLALDECGSFDMVLPLIRRIWFLASPSSYWILLIDTNSDIAPLAGTTAREGSRRTSDFDTHQLTQPFSSMPLDVNLTYEDRKKLFAPGLTSSPVSSPPTLSELNLALHKLGRPLWSDTRYHSDGLIKPRPILGKLVWPAEWQWPDDASSIPLNPQDELNQNLLALASRRISLELSSKPGPEHWYQVVSRQIAHHLRFVGRIFSTSDAIISSTPSEPSLSAAAAWSFRTHGPDSAAARWGMVAQAIVVGSQLAGVNVGAQGEQGVALLCSMAIDLALSRRYQPQLHQSSLKIPSTDDKSDYKAIFGLVSVREWLQTLIGTTYFDTSKDNRDPRIATSTGMTTEDMDDIVMAEDEQDDDHQQAEHYGESAQSRMPSSLARWASRTWLNFKHTVTLPEQVAQNDGAETKDLLVELWFRHAAAQGIINQTGWDFLIPVYESEGEQPPSDDQAFQAEKLSYIAIQVKNRVKRPSQQELEAAVGPSLEAPAVASSDKQCLELFVDMRGSSNSTGHVYSQRRHPAASPFLRHHVTISGLDGAAWPVLTKLQENARKQVGLLFGNTDSLNTLQFDQTKARYVRGRSPQQQQAWYEVETAVNGALVRVTQPNICWERKDSDRRTNDQAPARQEQKRKQLDP